MEGKVTVSVRPPYDLGGNPYPVAFLWIGNDIMEAVPCGTVKRRVKWLPRWVPFNTRYDYSRSSQMACVRMLHVFGEQLKKAAA